MVNMKKIIFGFILAALSLSLSLSNAATVSAQDVFDEVNYFLVLNYGGFSSANVREFADKYQTKLDMVCKDKNPCPAENAYPVIETMLEELNDSHTRFIAGGAKKVLAYFSGTGSSSGFGLDLRVLKESRVFVDDVIEGSSAEKVGFKRGDWILGLNGNALTTPKTLFEAWEIAESSSSSSRITVFRQGKSLNFRLQPQTISSLRLPSLKMRDDGVAVLKVPGFIPTPKVGQTIHALVLEAQAKKAKAIVVDLRNNGGGKLEDEMAGVSAFIPDGLERRLVSKQPLSNFQAVYRQGSIEQVINGQKRLTYKIAQAAKWTLPMAVLVNENSASAAEYFGLDIQTAKRGLVIGERTAGVANTAVAGIKISDGSFLLVSVAQSVRPDGTTFPEFVTPNIEVKDDLELLNRTGRDAIMEKALETLAR
jgi:carboxyl-terminal processing protease